MKGRSSSILKRFLPSLPTTSATWFTLVFVGVAALASKPSALSWQALVPQERHGAERMGSAGGRTSAPGMPALPMIEGFVPLEHAGRCEVPYITAPELDLANEETKRSVSRPADKTNLTPAELLAPPGKPSPGLLRSDDFFLGGKFAGVADTGYLTPDATIAAGPKNVVVATNGALRVFKKNGTPAGSQSLIEFFSPLGEVAFDGEGPYSPTLKYDEYIDRFWLLAASTGGVLDPERSSFLIGLSDSDDAMQGWTVFALDATLDGSNQTSNWCIEPKLGVDAQAIYLTGNMVHFPFSAYPDVFEYAKIRVMTKDQFLGNAVCCWWDFWNLREDFLGGTPSKFVQPAYMHGANPENGEFLIDSHSFCISCPPNTLEVWHLTNAQRCCDGSQSGPDLNQVSHDVGGFAFPPDAPQFNSSTPIDTGNTRLLFAIWKDGLLSTGQNMGCDTQLGFRPCIGFTELNVSGFPSIATVNDWALEGGFYPSVDVNAAGDKVMVYNSAESSYVTLRWIGIPSSSTCTNCIAFGGDFDTFIQDGLSQYVQFDERGRNRWGNYFGAAADPDGVGIWVHGEFPSEVRNMWSTEVGLLNETLDTYAPNTSAHLSPGPSAAGWNGGDVRLTLDAMDTLSGVSVLVYSASGAQAIPSTTVNGGSASFDITAEGLTTILFSAEDHAGNVEGTQTAFVRIDRTPPAIDAPRAVTAGTGPGATVCGAVVSDAFLGTPVASDNSGTVMVDRSGVPSGNVFPVGSTTVTYTATDPVGHTTSDTQEVIVNDTTLPVVPMLPDITVNATSPAGAQVAYSLPAVTDNCPGASVVGAPSSGSTFAIGTTIVMVTGTDASGNNASQSFQVIVIGPAGQTTALGSLVRSLGLDRGMEKNLMAKLNSALSAIDAGRRVPACSHLDAFIHEVLVQTGKKIPAVQAVELIAAASQVQASLGCPGG